ncbi:glucodextranase DOMON-like domain-containing protein [Thermococcus sp.]
MIIIVGDTMRKAALLIAVFMFFGVFGFALASATTVAVDLAHGENAKYLSEDVIDKETNKTLAHGITKTITDIKWAYFGDPTQAETLGIENLGNKITADALKNVDVLILGQPTSPFDPDEIQAISDWFEQGGKVLWVAGDSDYGSGVQAQDAADSVLDMLGIGNLRIDLCSVEDPTSNAGAGYRVVGLVNPDPDTPMKDMLTKGFKYGGKVLYHGPGVVAYVDDQGNWKPLVGDNVPEGIYRIVRSSPDGTIVENNDPPANAYSAGDNGQFPLLVAQVVKLDNGKKSILIVSGESPYGDYQPTWTPKYHGVDLDGPQFVTNILHWAIEMATYEPLKDVVEIKDPVGDDHGPGTYTYPTDKVFNQKGLFDLTDVKIKEGTTKYVIEFYFKNLGGNPWNGPNGFSLQIIEAYFDFKEGGNTKAIKEAKNGPGSNVQLDPNHPWDAAIRVFGWGSKLLLPDGKTVDVKAKADLDKNVIIVEIPKDYLKINEDTYMSVLVGSQDGFGVDNWRAIAPKAEQWKGGGADTDAVVAGVAPRVYDLLVPEWFKPTQEEQLKSYDAKATKLAIVRMISLFKKETPTETSTTSSSSSTTSTTQTSTTSTTSSSSATATSSSSSASSTSTTGGKTCGPAALIGLALIPLLLRRRK